MATAVDGVPVPLTLMSCVSVDYLVNVQGMTKVVAQGLEAFPNNKRLSDAELFGAIRTLNSITEAITAATTGGMPEK
jgi:hypothetical protein